MTYFDPKNNPLDYLQSQLLNVEPLPKRVSSRDINFIQRLESVQEAIFSDFRSKKVILG